MSDKTTTTIHTNHGPYKIDGLATWSSQGVTFTHAGSEHFVPFHAITVVIETKEAA